MPYHGSQRVLSMIHRTPLRSTKRHERACSFSCCGKKREKSAEKVDRTPDLMIFSHTLSQLSYLGFCFHSQPPPHYTRSPSLPSNQRNPSPFVCNKHPLTPPSRRPEGTARAAPPTSFSPSPHHSAWRPAPRWGCGSASWSRARAASPC